MKNLLLIAALTLAAASLVGCSGDDDSPGKGDNGTKGSSVFGGDTTDSGENGEQGSTGASGAPSTAEFCTFVLASDRVVGTAGTPEEQFAAAQGEAPKLREFGVPVDMPQEARGAYEALLNRTETGTAAEVGGGLMDGIPNAEALNDYFVTACADQLAAEQSSAPTAAVPTAAVPTAVPAE